MPTVFKEDSWKPYMILPFIGHGSELSHRTIQSSEKVRKGHLYSGQPHAQSKTGSDNRWNELCCTVSPLSSTTSPPFLCSSHTDFLQSSNQPSSYLSHGLCSCHFTCLVYPCTHLHIARSLSPQDSAQMSLPQRDLLRRLCKKSPPSITYCLIFFITFLSTEIIFYLPPLEYNFHMTGIFFVFTAISLLPNTIPSTRQELNIS